jgi:hypothetical protein
VAYLILVDLRLRHVSDSRKSLGLAS